MKNKIRMALIAASACLITASPALAGPPHRRLRGESELSRLIAGREPGRAVDCISLPSIRSTRIIDRTAIVYDAGRTIYVNRPRSGAQSLHRDDILVTRPTDSRLCSLDVVRLIDSGTRMQSGFVGLDRFVPYVRPRPARR